MKRNLLFFALSVLLLCASCDREGRRLTGDYSYKLSGEVALTDADGQTTHHLVHRNGQMNIRKDKSQKAIYIITMNEMAGGAYTMKAEVHGDSLRIDPYSFSSNILSTLDLPSIGQDETPSLVYQITAFGGGILNEDILIIREAWTGYQSGNSTVRVYGPEMTIIAEKN